MKPWVLLDRDGVINHDSEAYIKTPDEWLPIEGSLEAILMINQKGYQIGVATNQSGVARGLYNEDTLTLIHNKMIESVEAIGGRIQTICFCPHHPDDGCLCRKPKTGLLEDIASQNNFDLKGVPFVGDSWRDIQAGIRAQCTPVLVKTGYGQQTYQAHMQELADVAIFENLAAFAEYLPKISA